MVLIVVFQVLVEFRNLGYLRIEYELASTGSKTLLRSGSRCNCTSSCMLSSDHQSIYLLSYVVFYVVVEFSCMPIAEYLQIYLLVCLHPNPPFFLSDNTTIIFHQFVNGVLQFCVLSSLQSFYSLRTSSYAWFVYTFIVWIRKIIICSHILISCYILKLWFCKWKFLSGTEIDLVN